MRRRNTLSIASGWNDEREAALRELWADGLSTSVIAKKLGGFTRSAVIGKARRMKLPPHSAYVNGLNAARARGSKHPRVARAPQPRQPRTPPEGRIAAPKSVCSGPIVALEGPLLGTAPKPWLKRAAGECAFPVSGHGADVHSCCAAVHGETPYCTAHHDTMYQPSKVKTSTKRLLDEAARRRWAA